MQEKNHSVAVITGGGTGIGAATAEELAGTGVKVVVVGRRPKPLEEVASRIKSRGGTAVAHPADISDFSAMENLAEETVKRFGRIDLVVANAALPDFSSIDSGERPETVAGRHPCQRGGPSLHRQGVSAPHVQTEERAHRHRLFTLRKGDVCWRADLHNE